MSDADPRARASDAREDRVEGTLLGGACGDALGVPYELGSAPLAAGEVPRMIGGGLGPYAPGEWSDDTQMAVVIARAAAEHGLRTVDALDAVVTGWVDWLASGASDVGTQTRQVLGEVAADVDGARAAERARLASYALHAQTGRTAGNGSLMRTAPVALALLDDPAALGEQARAISGLTHADPLAGDACVLWCHAIRRAVLDGDVPDLAEHVVELPHARRDQWAGWIADAERRTPSAFAPNGYVVTALQAAWSAICHPLGDGPLVVASLSAAVHAGDDTDTVAAIAGSLLGAAHGASALSAEWLDAVHGWPGLRADDLRDLARRVADRGDPAAVDLQVSDELDEVAEHLVSRGLGEGHHFVVHGRPVRGGRSSEYIGLRVLDDGSYRVWYSGDRGTPRTYVETPDWAVARQRFVDEVELLGASRGDWKAPRRHRWKRR
ncbi:ADP-ribosylglycohydrolase family protein [Nocardioides KLBMP 9356]|uniref:ADP-ribosylglycohydrolase family protein n=1 Tax=Nocardioides potassii TaxID=2911371 RepID=A0ABS9H768_9ACTN|nr:ADP-ribosylglycohydrolase family protein [Nocardioides potassii]MCF6376051.1 ADP-ribosylglycohydrolase family protein [Nocardioides potassii]